MKAVGRPPRRRWLADLKAEALAWWVSASSDQRLQSVMHSHLRGVLLRQIFRTIRQRARPEKRINAVVESGSPAAETAAPTAIGSRSPTKASENMRPTAMAGVAKLVEPVNLIAATPSRWPRPAGGRTGCRADRLSASSVAGEHAAAGAPGLAVAKKSRCVKPPESRARSIALLLVHGSTLRCRAVRQVR